MFIKRTKIAEFELGWLSRDGDFGGLLEAGTHWFFDPLDRIRIEVTSQRAPWLVHEKLDLIVKSGVLEGRAQVLDLKDYERALVWIDGRFSHVLPPGLSAYWTAFRDVKVEVVDARALRFVHPDLAVILKSPLVEPALECAVVPAGHVGVLFPDASFVEALAPGRYAFSRHLSEFTLSIVNTPHLI